MPTKPRPRRATQALTRVVWGALPLAGLGAPVVWAADGFFSLTGSFTQPSVADSFVLTPTAPGPITAATFHHTGGVNAAGQAIAGGSFDPVLTLQGSNFSESDDN